MVKKLSNRFSIQSKKLNKLKSFNKLSSFKKLRGLNKKGLENEIMGRLIFIVGIIALVIITTSAITIYNSNMNTLNNSLNSTLKSTSSLIERTLYTFEANAVSVSNMESIKSKVSSKNKKLTVMESICEQYGYDEVGFVSMNGKGYSNLGDFDLSDQEHFQVAKEGKTFVGEPTTNQNGEVVIMSSSPVYDGEKIIGTVYIADKVETILERIQNITFGKTGYAYIINKDGTAIFHPNKQVIIDKNNAIELSKEDSNYRSLANAVTEMLEKRNGITEYRLNGKNMYATYSPVEGYEDWTLILTAPKNEFTGAVMLSVIINLLVGTIVLIGALVIIKRYLQNIITPINNITERVIMLSEGDLHTEVEVFDSKNEIGVLSVSLQNTIRSLNLYINEISQVLGKLSEGNLDVNTTVEFKGDFLGLKDATEVITESLNDTIKGINESSELVADGADQMSNSAFTLAGSVTEQVSLMEELSASMSEISERVKITASSAMSANEKSDITNNAVKECSIQMKEMLSSMEEIKEASSKINIIIKNIENIAAQTQLLSLNASIEAARAGDAGRGFAVVANEVKNLATESSNAANDTITLIGKSYEAVERGMHTVNAAANALEDVISNTENVSKGIDEITKVAQEQSESIEQINLGVKQLADSITNDSAVAEENSAISQELNGQAQTLKELIIKFKLK